MLTIRRATSDDIETLFEIRTSVRENYQSREELERLGITPDTLVDMLGTSYAAWVVDVDGVAAGFSMADCNERTIFGMFVRPEYEGRGVGRLALCAAEEWLVSQGITEAWLTTGPDTRAAGFYQRMGWQESGRLPDGQIRFTKCLQP